MHITGVGYNYLAGNYKPNVNNRKAEPSFTRYIDHVDESWKVDKETLNMVQTLSGKMHNYTNIYADKFKKLDVDNLRIKNDINDNELKLEFIAKADDGTIIKAKRHDVFGNSYKDRLILTIVKDRKENRITIYDKPRTNGDMTRDKVYYPGDVEDFKLESDNPHRPSGYVTDWAKYDVPFLENLLKEYLPVLIDSFQ